MLKQIASSLCKKKQLLNKKLPCFHSSNTEFLSSSPSAASSMSQIDIGSLHRAAEAIIQQQIVNNNTGNVMSSPSPLVSFVLDLKTNQMTTTTSFDSSATSTPSSYFFIEQEDYPVLFEELHCKYATGDLLRMKNRNTEKLMEHVQHCGFEVQTTTEIYFPNELQNKIMDEQNNNNNTAANSTSTSHHFSTSPFSPSSHSPGFIYQEAASSSFTAFKDEGMLDTFEGLEVKNRNYQLHGYVVSKEKEEAEDQLQQQFSVRQLSYIVQQLAAKQSKDQYSVIMNKNSFALYNGSIPVMAVLMLKGRPYVRRYTYGLQKRRNRFYRKEEQTSISQEQYDQLVNTFVGSKKLVVVEPESVELLVQNLSLFDKLLTQKNVRVNIPFLSELRKKQQQATISSISTSSTSTSPAGTASVHQYEQALEWFYKHRNYSKLNHWNCITVDENAQAKNPKATFRICNQDAVALAATSSSISSIL